jgi:hypothetical protein
MNKLILCGLFFLITRVISGQAYFPETEIKDSILLNNGKYVVSHITDTAGFSVELVKPHSRGQRKVEILKDNIFSIRFGATGKTSVFYVYDTLIGNDFTVEEARRFISGEQDAERGYHAFGTTAAAFAVGVASGAVGSFLALVPPFAFAGFMSYKYVKIRHGSVHNMNNVHSDAYLYGYAFVARRKRTLKALMWGGIGVAVGTVAHFIIQNNTN